MPVATLPQISISLAPPELPVAEPYSPFAWEQKSFPNSDASYRATHLTPPPTDIHFKQRSPLAPTRSTTAKQAGSKGLDRDHFEALLKTTREKVVSSKEHDLRKEIALKAHKSKQVERRARFISKVMASPSATDVDSPATPPESPAILHYSLPSPGLISPLALFSSLNDKSTGPLSYGRDPWVEQVDFRPRNKQPATLVLESQGSLTHRKTPSGHSMPSLDQISARLAPSAALRTTSPDAELRASRFPAFLAHGRQQTPSPPPAATAATANAQAPSRPLRGGLDVLKQRVQAPRPVRSVSATAPSTQLLHTGGPQSKIPMSPMLSPNIEVTTTLVPRTSTHFTTMLSELNLQALNSRERRAKDMLFTLRRRTQCPSEEYVYNGRDEVSDNDRIAAAVEEVDDRKRKWKRHSAPAELSPLPRSGFAHPVLALPGAF